MSDDNLTPERVYRIAGDLMATMFADHSEGAGERWAADPRTRAVAEAVYRAGREDAARDIEDAYDVARGTLRRGALRKAVRIARGQQPAGEQR